MSDAVNNMKFYEFGAEMVEAQKAAIRGDWKGLKQIFARYENLLFQPFDLFGNTAIHVVARSPGNARLLRELLQMMKQDGTQLLEKPNDEGNTILHEVIFHDKDLETVNVIMEFDESVKESLLELKNGKKETPPFRAAKYGNLSMLRHFHAKYGLESKHFTPSELYDDKLRPILYTCVLTFNFELELDCASRESTRDIESSHQNDEAKNTPMSVFSSLNYAVWNSLAKAELLVKSGEDSWKKVCRNQHYGPLVVLLEFPPNVTEKKKEIELKYNLQKEDEMRKNLEEKKGTDQKNNQKDKTNLYDELRTKWETPLFLAAASGIIEVVKLIVDEYPEAISHVNEDGLNVLHVAVKHRQLEIYEYIEKSPAFDALKPRISLKDGRTILHQAASMEYYREQVLPGVAYQLQDELQWYHRVRSIVPVHYLMHCDKDGLTAGDRLDIEHAEMHDQAKQWMKETAQSCSTVAVLIAGVVFAAAYAIPGGNEGGKPVLHSSSAFRIFTVMDVVALASSLGSVVMFLSILTSPFDLWDFHTSLPRKLKLGFLMLFFALITTMLAFAATILLTIRMEGNKKTTTFTYSLAFVIVSIFGMTQFPLYKMVQEQVQQCSKIWRKKCMCERK
ncbi:hypothetical protein RJT34_15933 [Clitoria ternatea]|uniref:PGG domain-containing protein n=1 Tax=Clitoria ternatea TaxID=43366 RepID=A0AAN9PD61_CLITE